MSGRKAWREKDRKRTFAAPAKCTICTEGVAQHKCYNCGDETCEECGSTTTKNYGTPRRSEVRECSNCECGGKPPA